MAKKIIASIVIPAKGRAELLERAIDSVLKQKNSDQVEIVVIDDGSIPELKPKNLRQTDRLFRFEKSVGAAVGRNKGIDIALGENIYLLDSDDYFIRRNFVADHEEVEYQTIYYCDIQSQGFNSNFPSEVKKNNFFESIFFRHKFVAQTSSLVFKRESDFRFDEILPKHQDWDFNYVQCLLKGHRLLKLDGAVFFDRSDQKSVSRTFDHARSLVWLKKLSHLQVLEEREFHFVRFNLLARTAALPIWEVLRDGVCYVLARSLSPDELVKIIYRRILS